MANSGGVLGDTKGFVASQSWRVYLTVLLVAAVIYPGCIVSPPSLMDDVDAVLTSHPLADFEKLEDVNS